MTPSSSSPATPSPFSPLTPHPLVDASELIAQTEQSPISFKRRTPSRTGIIPKATGLLGILRPGEIDRIPTHSSPPKQSTVMTGDEDDQATPTRLKPQLARVSFGGHARWDDNDPDDDALSSDATQIDHETEIEADNADL